MAKIEVLVNVKVPDRWLKCLSEVYDVHYWPDRNTHDRLLKDPLLKRIRAMQSNGTYGVSRAFFDAMPNLEIICTVGAGFERIDLDAARERGIAVTHCVGTNTAVVAEHAFALLLGVVRGVPMRDRDAREHRWNDHRGLLPSIEGKKMGIFGLGGIGMEIVKRAVGFDLEIGYHNRRRRDDVLYRYFADLKELAAWCDILMVAAPGGAETYHAVDSAVLDALGPGGYIVNSARGSLVDTEALIAALSEGRIAGAALDVIEGEPEVPQALVDMENVVLSPHVGGHSVEAAMASVRQALANLEAHFGGKPVLTPVPGLYD